MPLTTLTQTGLCTLLNGPVIKVLAQQSNDKAISIVKEYLTFTTYEIAQTYQNSYAYTLAAIAAGLATPEQKVAFLQKLSDSKLTHEFSEQINSHYLQPFVAQRGVQSEALPELRQQFIEQLKELSKLPPIFSGEDCPLTESELAAVVNHKGTLAITESVLEQLRGVTSLDESLEAFLRYNELLGNAILYFFGAQLEKDARVNKTEAELQREGLWADVRDLKTAQEKFIVQIQQQLDEQNAQAMQALKAGDFAMGNQIMQQLQNLQKTIDNVPQLLQQAQTAWQSSHQQLIDFSTIFDAWAHLLDDKVEQVLEAMEQLHECTTAEPFDNKANLLAETALAETALAETALAETALAETAEISDDVKALKRLTDDLMARFDLGRQIKPQDEFTHHNSKSLELIQKVLAKLKALPREHHEYHKLMIMIGSVVSSTGDIAEAEQLFLQAKESAQNDAEKALAGFNLFQLQLRHKAYPDALAELQTAIEIDPSYGLHEVEKYPIKQLLGAGDMGSVFLCLDEWRENKVVVKCFWEGKKGRYEDIFKDVLLMHRIKSPNVLKTLNYGYVDAVRQERPYLVTEYIEDALDGEAWLAKHGKLDLPTCLEVAQQIAQSLVVAHQAGVYHLDLRPANLLLKWVDEHLVVKIIDFGLVRVATSLKQQAAVTQSSSDKSLLVQSIFGTLDYASPEQLGQTQYGQPGAKSDVFAFGATLYRLLSGESPRFPHPSELPDVPKLQSLLLDCLKPNPEKRPDIEAVMARLSDLLGEKKPEKIRKIAESVKHQADEEHRKPVELAQRQADEKLRKPAELAQRQADEKLRKQAELAQRQAERKKQAELAQRQAEEERKKQAELAERQAEAERKNQAELAERQAERKKQAELAERQAEEQRRKQAELAERQAEEERKKQAELAERQAERKKQAELAERQAEEQRRKQAELAELQAERKKQAELAELQAEEQRRKQAELAELQAERKKQAELAELQAEEQRRKQAELAELQAEEQRRKQAELAELQAELKKQAELAQLQAELKKQAELAELQAEEQRRKPAELAQRQAERKKQAELGQRQAELDQRQAEEKRQQAELDQLQAELAQRQVEAERKKQAELVQRQAEEERRKQAELAQLQAEEERKKVELAQDQAELAPPQTEPGEEERLKQAELLAKRQAEQEEEERLKKAEWLALRQAEKEEEERRKQAELLAKRQTEQEEAELRKQAEKQHNKQIQQKESGQIFCDCLTDGSECSEMVWIPAGRFKMGDIQDTGYNDEQPVHEVWVESFAMGRYPITFAEYDKFVEVTGRKKPNDEGWGRDNRPVINVSWYDAIAYVEWLSEQTGQQYRLPTEAEWESAARAGTETDYWWGNDIDKMKANCWGSGSQWSGKQTSPVGSFDPNPFGLYDTVGNVWEWTFSEYEDKYSGKELVCVGKEAASLRVIRGGAWLYVPRNVRASNRNSTSHDDHDNLMGFRIALSKHTTKSAVT